MTSLAEQRNLMVERQIAARGIASPNVLDAMRTVPREAFVPADQRPWAYADRPLPIAEGQTISQPYIVALMLDAVQVEPGDRLLDVGAGSGYAAAIAAQAGAEVFAIERHRGLVDSARAALDALGFERIALRAGDGTLGWAEHAPFDAIVVAAAGPGVPDALKRQLAIGGRLVIPVGEFPQRLVRITRDGEERWSEEDLGAVTFVPLIGAQGWPSGR